MTEPRVGSRYELQIDPDGEKLSKHEKDYFAIHAGDLEDVPEEEDLPGYVHSYEVGSTVDGPGLRFVMFVSGCLLRCQYCHNPDTWHKRNGHPVLASRAIEEIGKYANVLKVTKGGITISGGEPMVQRPFVMQIFRHCKKLGIHTCIDTAGRMGEKMTDEDLSYIDLHLLDIKSGDPEIYKKVTKQPLQPTLDYAKRLSALQRPMWIRYVLVPGLTDGFDNVERVAEFAAGLSSVQRVEILRFHQLGSDKWTRLGLEYPLADCEAPTQELTERVREQFRSRGLTVY